MDPQSNSTTQPPGTPSTLPTIGLENWEHRRRQWTQNHRPYNPESRAGEGFRDHAALREVEPVHYDAIYQSLVLGRRFAKPVPLDFITTVLVGSTVGKGRAVANGRQ
ncbi:hypothetical protein BC829DRAFT_445595 [Chytridium lagenaria]|nr:hypothetical protein BC829DRAFT_445595 [Chytridium lagenaria]